MLNSRLKEIKEQLEQNSLHRKLRHVEGSQKERIKIDGHDVLNFCSNNYLGLADDDRLKQAASQCLQEEGVGAGASRLVCGHMSAHQKLEEKIAKFKNKEKCLVFSTGYMANVGIISSLFGRDDIIFCDRLNHASIIDGVLLSQAQYKRYPHCDTVALEKMLQGTSRYRKRCIITDSVFSMDGDIAPLNKIVYLAQKYDCIVMVDEAHALGVVGKNGRGLAEHFGLEDKIDIQMGTLSKAAGSFGAYVCGSEELISYFINKARSFIYTTGLPPAVCAASARAIEIIEEDKKLREDLWENTNYMRVELKGLGFDTMYSTTPIIPILVKDSKLAVEFSDRLFKEGIFISAIRPPTVPQNSARLRLTLMATHKKEDLDYTLDKFKQIGNELCLL